MVKLTVNSVEGEADVLASRFRGRLGEPGQPVIHRKAQSAIEEFARNLARELASR